MSVQQQMVDDAEQAGFDEGRQAERKAIVDWLRYLLTANRNDQARQELNKMLSTGGSTIGSIMWAIERGEHNALRSEDK